MVNGANLIVGFRVVDALPQQGYVHQQPRCWVESCEPRLLTRDPSRGPGPVTQTANPRSIPRSPLLKDPPQWSCCREGLGQAVGRGERVAAAQALCGYPPR